MFIQYVEIKGVDGNRFLLRIDSIMQVTNLTVKDRMNSEKLQLPPDARTLILTNSQHIVSSEEFDEVVAKLVPTAH